MDVEALEGKVDLTTEVEKTSLLDESSNLSNFVQDVQPETETALDKSSNESSNLDALDTEEAIALISLEQIDSTSADETEEAITPERREDKHADKWGVANVAPEPSPLPQKPSIEVAETTPSSKQFQKGDRVWHSEYGAGTVEYISDWMAFCIFDAATDRLGHLHHNTRRSPNISELSHLQE
jgi:hypothetical protein